MPVRHRRYGIENAEKRHVANEIGIAASVIGMSYNVLDRMRWRAYVARQK